MQGLSTMQRTALGPAAQDGEACAACWAASAALCCQASGAPLPALLRPPRYKIMHLQPYLPPLALHATQAGLLHAMASTPASPEPRLTVQGHAAKLGEENAFYFDEELKQWRERGAPPPPPPAPLAPPPAAPAQPAGPPGEVFVSLSQAAVF